jgi:acyl-CoA reductase-like NAD-dependent aldehyde dehydrogenase
MPLESVNPATGETFARYDEMSAAGLEAALEAAWNAFLAWKDAPFRQRSRLLLRAAESLRSKSADLACLATLEMGEPIAERGARGEEGERGGRGRGSAPCSPPLPSPFRPFEPMGRWAQRNRK